MIWILATRGASTKLRSTPFTETVIEGVHSIVYQPGIEPMPYSGGDQGSGELGTFDRGIHRISGFVFSYNGLAAETLFGIGSPIDLIIRYRASGQRRMRTLLDVIFIGDATVTVPALNKGVPELVGVPFRVQIPTDETLTDHVTDAVDS
ncbi:MAG TPA: hypothetical protein VMY37_13390 [Thermoguttaceae bacterium]|nr:hypothetical protein [Thermoguttaceae bacterium]